MVFSELTAKLSLDSSGFQAGVDDARQSLGKLSDKASNAGRKMQSGGKKLTAGVSAPIAAAGGAAVKAAADFESSMTEVEKVTNPKTAEEMGGAIQDMAGEMPIAQSELAGIAEQAGRLGVEGTENIQSYTETVGKMSTATDLASEEAADAFARIGTLMDIPVEQSENLGSAMNTLANNMGTSSSEITNVMARAGGSFNALGVGKEEALGLAAAMNEVSPNSRLAAGGMQRMAEAMMDPSNVSAFAEALGVTEEEFKNMRDEDPSGTLLKVAEAADESKESADILKGELGKAGKEFQTLGQNTDSARDAMEMSNEAWEENTSLQEEFDASASTTNAQAQIMKNRLRNVGISIGEILLPMINNLLDRLLPLAEKFQGLSDRQQKVIVAVGALAAALGPLLFIVGTFLTMLPALVAGFGAVATAIGVLLSPIGLLVLAAGALYYAWRTNLFGIRDIASDVFETLKGWASDLKDAFPNSIQEAVDAVKDIFLKWHPAGILWDKREEIFAALPDYDDFKTLGNNLVVGLANGFYAAAGAIRDASGWLWDWVWSGVPDWQDVKQSGRNLVQGLVNGLYAKYSAIKSGAAWLKDWVKSGIPDWEWAKQQGRNFIVGFVNGLYSRDGYLQDGAKWIGNVIDAWTPGSDAEKGPLSNLTAWGEAVPETMAEGMDANRGTVAEASRGMAGEAAPGAAGGAGGAGGMGVGVPVVELHVADGADDLTQVLFDALEDDIETTIRKREQAQHRRSKRVNRRDG